MLFRSTNYTAGDLPYYASGSAFTKLGIGTSGYFLTSSGSAPQWTDPTTLAVTSISFGTTGLTPSTATKGAVTVAGTLSANNGGTGESGTLTGILYGNGASPFTVATSSQISTSASQNMPTCNYYQSSPQTLVANTATKITLTSNIWDTTSGMFSSSRFTPTIGGYYQVNAAFQVSAAFTGGGAYIYKNGSVYSYGPATSSASVISGTFTVSCLVYLNGSTDYIEFYGLIGIGQALSASAATTFMQIAMVRTT